MCRAKIEIGDIFRRYGDIYRKKYASSISLHQLRSMRAIEICRTAKLGGHIEECDKCGVIRISYNSCRNRHCPKCQYLPTEKWLLNRKKDLLPVHYFHVVFTIPDDLNTLVYSNQKTCYGIFFKAASQTLLELTKDTKYLGAQVGITAILHTWGQNLLFHPHIHCLITGGGLSKDNTKWIPARDNFFLPVRVMSKLFRGKFLAFIKEEFYRENLRFNNSLEDLSIPQNFEKFIKTLKKQDWVVYCKPPLKNPNAVIDYFGRYTHRVAISNYRIVKIENHKVYFKWKDYRDNSKIKIMALDVIEFIRRFLLHILPNRFVKIRYYGLLSNRNRKTKIAICISLLNDDVDSRQNSCVNENKSWQDLLLDLTGVDVTICPICKKGRMRLIKTILPIHNNSPPAQRWAA